MKKWKEASSLIVGAAGRSQIIKNMPSSKSTEVEKCNFKLLALKKTTCVPIQTPQICVFPGGSISVADSAKGWERLFLSFGLSINTLSNSLVHGNMSKLPIFNDTKKEEIPRWLSLRITAIRETFEECGLLLCRTKEPQQLSEGNNTLNLLTTNHFEINEINSWRVKVLDDPFQFLSLCLHFNCYPDVEHLCFWSNWLTPNHLSERYDAVFFLTNIGTPDLCRESPDYREIASVEWLKPDELLSLSRTGEILLKPPQWYEINSLKNIQDSSFLQTCMNQRSQSCSRWMPVRIIAFDGEISLLPGDMLYPRDVDLCKPYLIHRKQETMESLRCELMHRMEHSGLAVVLLDTRSSK